MNELISREQAILAMIDLHNDDCEAYEVPPEEFFDAYRACDALRQLPAEEWPEWYPVMEYGFPEEGVQVLVSDGKHVWIDESECIDIAGDGSNVMNWASDYSCWEDTAWAELPEPPNRKE